METPSKSAGHLLSNLRFSVSLPSPKKCSLSGRGTKNRCQRIAGKTKTVIQMAPKKASHEKLVRIEGNAMEEILQAVDDVTEAFEKISLAEKSPVAKSVRKSKLKEISVDDVINLEENELEESESDEEMDEEIVPEKCPPQMNLLILGETGVGKSTFINGLVNYLKYESMEEALENGPQILIKSSFTLTDDDFVSREIVSEPTLVDEQSINSNEKHGKGQSATQEPKSYVFSWKSGDGQKSIRIIDTPGIGDTRGIDQDKENFDKILSFIADYSEIHAICILVKPNTSRLTLAFRFCIDELLVHLHKSASRNIVFCFTNTRGTLYKPGDTLPTLKEHLARLQDNRGIDIPLDMSTLYAFDNESFRFLCAVEDGMRFSEAETENFSASWTKSVDETLRLFTRISSLPAHSVNSTLCLNNTRAAIITLAKPLAEVARNQLINMKLIQEKVDEVEMHLAEGRTLNNSLYVDQVILTAQEIGFPQTVCTSDRCVSRQRFGTNPNAPMQIVYKQICHAHCYLTGVQAETCPNTILQRCAAMCGQPNCQQCGCPWSTHMHLRYQLVETMTKVIDPSVQNSLKKNDDTVKTIQLFLKKEREKMAQLKLESEKISSYCVEFAAFLSQNSIIPYNDSYQQYILHLIRVEKDNVSAGGSDCLLKELTRYKEEYEQQVLVLNKNIANAKSRRVRSVEEMNSMVEELKKLRHSGTVLTEVTKLETMKVRQTQAFTGHVVDLNAKNSWFAGEGKRKKKGKKEKKQGKKKGKK